jgi:hypothetical protein
MKFIVSHSQFFDPEYTDTDILKQMSVYFREETGMIFIPEQKITLNEDDMNLLFSKTGFGDIKLQYFWNDEFGLQTVE